MKLVATLARSLQSDLQAELRDIERTVAAGTRDAGGASRPSCAGRLRAPGSGSGSRTAGATSTTVTLTNDLDGSVHI